jgi:hypothetical protein
LCVVIREYRCDNAGWWHFKVIRALLMHYQHTPSSRQGKVWPYF